MNAKLAKIREQAQVPIIIDSMPKTEYTKYKAYAGTVDFPLEKQKDLLYFKAVYVSSGTNKNSITFLPSELVKARKTVPHKAVDLEHEEDVIVGHIYSHSFVFTDGKEFEPEQLIAELGNDSTKLDSLDFDIVVAGVLYKQRFPELAQELEDKKWFISMEAFYEDFDVKVGGVILPKIEAYSLGLTEASFGKQVKAKLSKGAREYNKSLVSRVIRNIIFSGAGVVKHPANPNSIFLETASMDPEVPVVEGTEQVIDLTSYIEKVVSTNEDQSMNNDNKVKANTLVVQKWPLNPSNTSTEQDVFRIAVVAVEGEGSKSKFKFVGAYPSTSTARAEVFKLIGKGNSTAKYYITDFFTYLEAADSKLTMEEIIKNGNVGQIYETDEDGAVLATYRVETTYATTLEESPTVPFDYTVPNPVTEDGPIGNRRGVSEGICVSFKKYNYEYNGSTNPGKLLNEHWCTLFGETCPVKGASAKDPVCLRNTKNRTTKEEDDNSLAGENPPLALNEFASTIDIADIKNRLKSLSASIDVARGLVSVSAGKVEAAKWTTKYINDLPSSSFAIVESGVKSKGARHLPHHNEKGGGTANINLDLAHLRNALARVNQLKPLGKMSKDALVKRAMSHLNKHRAALKTTRAGEKVDTALIADIEALYEKRNKEIFGDKE